MTVGRFRGRSGSARHPSELRRFFVVAAMVDMVRGLVTQDHRTIWSTVTHLECQAPHQFDSQRLNLPTLTWTPEGDSRLSTALPVTLNSHSLRHDTR